jgi:hypothetical protein
VNDDAFDDAARLRLHQHHSNLAETRKDQVATHGAPCLVGKVTTSSGPTSPGFFAVAIYTVTGTLVEGATGTLTSAGYSIIAMNVGSAVPPAGTAILCTFTDFRWVFRYDS